MESRDKGHSEVMLDIDQFRECIRDNIVLIKRAFIGDLVIPEFGSFCGQIDEIYWKCRTNSGGKVQSL